MIGSSGCSKKKRKSFTVILLSLSVLLLKDTTGTQEEEEEEEEPERSRGFLGGWGCRRRIAKRTERTPLFKDLLAAQANSLSPLRKQQKKKKKKKKRLNPEGQRYWELQWLLFSQEKKKKKKNP